MRSRHTPRAKPRLDAEGLEPRLTLAGDAWIAAAPPIAPAVTAFAPPAVFAAFDTGLPEASPDRPWIGQAAAAPTGAVVLWVRVTADASGGPSTMQTLPIWGRLNADPSAPPTVGISDAGEGAPPATSLAALGVSATVHRRTAEGIDSAVPLDAILDAPPTALRGPVDSFVVIESASNAMLSLLTAAAVLSGAPGRPADAADGSPTDPSAVPPSSPSSDTPADEAVAPSWLDALVAPPADILPAFGDSAAAWLRDARGGSGGAVVLWIVPAGDGESAPVLVPLYARFDPAAAEDPGVAVGGTRNGVARLYPSAGDGGPPQVVDFAAGSLPTDGETAAGGFLVVHSDSNPDILFTALLPLFMAVAESSEEGQIGSDGEGIALLAGFLATSSPPSAPAAGLAHDGGASPTDGITQVGTLEVHGLPGSRIEYSTDGGRTWQEGHSAREGRNRVMVRQVDGLGRASPATAVEFVLDTRPPAAPRPRLSDGPTATPRRHADLVVGGLEPGARVEYSTDGGPWSGSWTPVEGVNVVRVRQIDRAGNASAASLPLRFRIDTFAAAPSVGLARDTGTSASDGITADARLAIGNVEPGATVRFSGDGGKTWTARHRPVEGRNTVLVRQIDAAGNVSASTSIEFTLDRTPPTVVPRHATTSPAPTPPLRIAEGDRVEYALGHGPWHDQPPAPRGRMPLRVRVIDVAGNASRAIVVSWDTPTRPGRTTPRPA